MRRRYCSWQSRRSAGFWLVALLVLFSLLVISRTVSAQPTSSPGDSMTSSSSPVQIAQALYQDSTRLVTRLEERKAQQQSIERNAMQQKQALNKLEMPLGQLQHQFSAMSNSQASLDQALTETSSSLDASKASAESSTLHYEQSLAAADKQHKIDQVKLWIQRVLLFLFGAAAVYFGMT